MTTSIDNKAYLLGIICGELGIDPNDFGDLSKDQMMQLDEIAEDALLDEPKTDLGKKMKARAEEERGKEDSDYNKSFNFNKDLNNNKISPLTVFVMEIIGKYAQRIVDKDQNVESEMLSEIIIKMNELEYPISYLNSPFNIIVPSINKLLNRLQGQVDHRKDEILAYSIGVRHPKFNTLDTGMPTIKNLDEAIKKLRESTGYTEADYRGE